MDPSPGSVLDPFSASIRSTALSGPRFPKFLLNKLPEKSTHGGRWRAGTPSVTSFVTGAPMARSDGGEEAGRGGAAGQQGARGAVRSPEV